VLIELCWGSQLPTSGFARQYSGVSTLSFLKHMTVQELTAEGIKKLGPTVETLAHLEGLGAHEYAVTLRLQWLNQNEGK
jgi:phosphoribosyl-ATP pyrophosphohydrolase/phosphoribosyl-AMP cyclohydrolase/histidinol dehydrogenase